MDTAALESRLIELREAVRLQGEAVRQLKADGAVKADLAKAVAVLKQHKKAVEEVERQLTPIGEKFDRDVFDDLMKRRFFFLPAYDLYGGVAGFFDLGPPACAIKANVLKVWRSHFVLEDNMLEIDCPCLTPEVVLKASGHVERFRDLMVHDVEDPKLVYRADHALVWFLEAKLKDPKTKLSADDKAKLTSVIDLVDSYDQAELTALLNEYQVTGPDTGRRLSDPTEFNLMFATSIGPDGNQRGFLRPETAQGIFVNFKRLLEYNGSRLPFAAAQIGTAFRNEISPRSGLLRVREFVMAEIEHFVHPDDKAKHSKFASVADVKVTLLDANRQLDGAKALQTTIGEAVATEVLANETHAYFLARIQQFLVAVGLDVERVRFRQHLPNEMAHYACDCWDAECLTSYGWIEIVGCADRSCFDLKHHSEASKTSLMAQRQLPTPKVVESVRVAPVKQVLGKALKKGAAPVQRYLMALDDTAALELRARLEADGVAPITADDGIEYTLDKTMVNIEQVRETVHHEDYFPSVIEPSFGIGRIIYSLLEQNFYVRDEKTGELVAPMVPDVPEVPADKKGKQPAAAAAAAAAAASSKGEVRRTTLTLAPLIAPVKCAILPLSNNSEFNELVLSVSSMLTKRDVSTRVDTSSTSIGRRYARADELGIPFGVTIDFESLKNNTVTLRDRDSMKQLRVPIDDLVSVTVDLSSAEITWPALVASNRYPIFESQDTA